MSKRGHTNVNTLEGNITHPPDYRPEYGNLLSFSTGRALRQPFGKVRRSNVHRCEGEWRVGEHV